MTFADPYWLLLGLLFCALLAALFYRSDRLLHTALTTFTSAHLIEKLTTSISPFRRAIKRFLLLLGLASLTFALARPQAGFRWEESQQRSVDILFAIDTSKSMLTQDVKPDRLTRAKMAIDDLSSHLDGDRLGIIAFAGEAFLQCPLTLDADAFHQSLDSIDTTTIPRGGTDIASAIREAQSAFRAEGGAAKTLILLTDGEELEGSALDAAKEAAKDGLKIDTIGVGTPSGDLIPIPSESGGTDFAHDPATGQIIKSHLDEARLRQIAQITGGTYRPLGARGEGITQLYQEELASLSHDTEATQKIRLPLEQFQWPLALSLLVLLIEPLISTRRSHSESEPPTTTPSDKNPNPSRFRKRIKQIKSATLLLILISTTSLPLHASPEAGEKAFEKGDYPKAEQEFEKAAAKTPRPEIQLDLGSAAYKNNQYDKASEAYQKTLQTAPLNVQQQAYYNLGDTLYRQGQQTEKSETKQTIQTWQQAIQSFENALKLKPDDADAKFNRDFVKRKLDELQKKSSQNNPNNSDQNKNSQPKQTPQNSPDNPKPNGNPNGAAQPSPSTPNQNQNPSGQPNPNSPPPPKQQPPEGKSGENQAPSPSQPGTPPNPPNSQPNGKNGTQPAPQNSQPGSNQSPSQGQGARQAAPGEMTPEEAKNLLNSVRGDERILPQNHKGENSETPPEKDW